MSANVGSAHRQLILQKKLDAKKRNSLPDSSFALPRERKYPMEDESHARNALSRSSGKPEEKEVKAKVHKRYPGIDAGK